LRRVWPPKWKGSALHKAMWNSLSVRPQRHVEATAALWAPCCVWGYLPTVRREDEGALQTCWPSGDDGATSEGIFIALIGHHQLCDKALIGCFALSASLFKIPCADIPWVDSRTVTDKSHHKTMSMCVRFGVLPKPHMSV